MVPVFSLWLCLILHGVLVFSGGVHFSLHRRGDRLARHEPANLTRLVEVLKTTEARYARTQRILRGNKIARTWTPKTNVAAIDEDLLQEPGNQGRWFINLQIGTPPQSLEVDVDMLSSDFYILQTTSEKGSKYNTFGSSSHVSNDARVHLLCRHPADVFHLNQHWPGAPASINLDFAMCNPSKSSPYTLLSSGAVLGLAPSLARMSTPNLLQQLMNKNVVNYPIWSVTLLDANSGILSLGGTIAQEAEEARIRGEVELEYLGRAEITPQLLDEQIAQRIGFFPSDTDSQFKWLSLRGATGWWAPLLSGIWLNGAKILKNQPALLDIQSPFILAPSLAAQRFYDAIGGSYRLPAPYSRFFAHPCLNKVNIAFELAGWMFPGLRGETRADAVHGPPGGPLSFGLLEDGTGYCVGIIVESEGNGALGDSWVLGEPFFRGMGVVFDVEKGRVGFRTY